MGQLIGRRIVQSRNWLNPELTPIPSFDFDFVYPITVFEAVRRTMDDNSSNLLDELEAIYRLIAGKQDIIQPGTPGNIMTWSGAQGQIGSLGIARVINPNPAERSHNRIPTERAIGDLLQGKADLSSFLNHVQNNSIHLTDGERNRWNAMTPLSSFQSHIVNSIVHITNEERMRWNSKASQESIDEHIYNTNNPHNVTAHQAGTYTRREIDELIAAIRETFFNYVNIEWNLSTNSARLVRYHPMNFHPNYVLGYTDDLPDVPDQSLQYFAIKPATNYLDNESNDAIIYIKRPALQWQEVGFCNMENGMMVIQFPETIMFVWVQGRFKRLFSHSAGDSDTAIGFGGLWRPVFDSNTGTLSFILSNDNTAPEPMVVRGRSAFESFLKYNPNFDGTEQEWIYNLQGKDGSDGRGVPAGGLPKQLLAKVSNEDFDTTWRSLTQIMEDLVLAGETLPNNVVDWNYLKNRPQLLTGPGSSQTDTMTQQAITNLFNVVNGNVNEIMQKITGVNGLEAVRGSLYDHLNDFNNPHRITPAQIGAISIAAFNDHVSNFNNPHNVTAEQIGLGNVNNTADMDKPVSDAVRLALQEITNKINLISNNTEVMNYMASVKLTDDGVTLVFTFRDNSTVQIDLPIKDIFNSIFFDESTKELVIKYPDGSEHRINIIEMITVYHGSVGSHIHVIIENDNIIRADIIPSSIGELEIMPSVHLRGSPTTNTQPVSDRSTRIATTEFVRGQVINNLISYEVDRPLSANMGRILNQRKVDIDDIIQIINDIEGIEVIDHLESVSPVASLSANMGRYLNLVKAPRVHTSPSGATFGRATISLFGHVRASEIDPLMDGTVFRGSDDGRYARADHRHPTDITRAPIHSPEFTGRPTAPRPPDDSNGDYIATTEWIRRNAVGSMKGESTTPSGTAIKQVVLRSTFMDNPVFLRQIGSSVSVTFTHADNSIGITQLNIQGCEEGPAPILFRGLPLEPGMIGENHTHSFVFDGTNWRIKNPAQGASAPIGNNPPNNPTAGMLWIPTTGPLANVPHFFYDENWVPVNATWGG